MPTRETSEKCPICGKSTDEVLRPFCSKRCADVDLHRWLKEGYVIPAAAAGEAESEDRD